MERGIKLSALAVFLPAVLAFSSLAANAQTYLPFGPQTNVPVPTVTQGGWEPCYQDTYDVHMDADTVLALCTGDRLMLACLETGGTVISLLAQAERSDVIFDTGNTQDLHVANGVGWYFNNDSLFSWGFVRAGDGVNKGNCDTDFSGASNERLCWHVDNFGGYRCGAAIGLNESSAFERIVFQPASLPEPNPIPTLSEWGLMVMAGILGMAGILVVRRRKAAA